MTLDLHIAPIICLSATVLCVVTACLALARNKKPAYDYRKLWTDFTRKTSAEIDLDRVCEAVVETVSETFNSPGVAVWLFSEGCEMPALAASTGFSPAESAGLQELAASLLRFARDRNGPIDLRRVGDGQIPGICAKHLEKVRIRYCVPLRAVSGFIGMMTLNDRAGASFSVEDFDLLQTFADQAAGLILNRKLFDNLGQAREREAFQAVSAFFAHDLKNVASALTLTLDNLPAHYDDPEFRADTLKIISRNLDKIRNMCGQLSPLDRKFELHLCECDINELISSTVSSLRLGRSLVADLSPVPKALLDPEQIRKVVLNLALNACESSANGAGIQISTCCEGDYLRFSVADQGCGMSGEFMQRHLFHPFRTTREKGSGIGLYQSKMIIEAHGGRIEAQSCEGKGSTFSVFLPLAGPG